MTSIDTPSSSESDEGSRKMDLVYFSNDFPKDDLQNLFRHLRNQAKTRQHTILAHFLTTATASVKHEIQALSVELKQYFRPFESLLDWADDTELRKSSLCGAVDGVLLVILQLAAYIGSVLKIARKNFPGILITPSASSKIILPSSCTIRKQTSPLLVLVSFRLLPSLPRPLWQN